VVGGDGTANFVANCIARNNYKVLLAVYPGGTCNTFCLSANIVTDSNRFSDLIIRNKVKKIDLIRFNNKYILNGFTFGFSMTCMDQDNLQIKREYPKLAYPYLVFRKYLFSNKLNFTSIWEIGDSSGIECNTAFITITNGSWHAGIEDFSVGGSYQDGLFRVMFIPGDKAKIIKFCNSLIIKRNREHISAPGVKYFSARFLELKLSDEDIPCSIDGEYCQFPGQTNYTFEICPSKLSIIDFD
jgi:diacylglycerol kinase (ATP)